MRLFSPSSVAGLLILAVAVQALTITEPSESTVINPQQPFTIKWTSTADDPQALTFSITGAGDFSIAQYQEVATNVQTSAGSVEVPANKVGNYGQFKIEARDASSSSVLTTSADFYLAQGNDQTMSITSNVAASGDGNGNVTPTSSGPAETGNPQINTVTGTDGTSVVLSGTVTPSKTPQTSAATTSRASSGSATGSAISSSTSSLQTSNAQMKLGADGNAMILSMAGMVAGLVALVA